MKVRFFFLSIVIFYFSCDSKLNNKTIKASDLNNKNSIVLSREIDNANEEDYFVLQKQIELQSIVNNHVNIGNIDKICYDETKEIFFVLDTWTKPGIYLFNKNGKFLHSIGSIGRGPGEYIQPFDIVLIEREEKIAVIDRTSFQVLIFSYSGIFDFQFSLKIDKNNIFYPEAIQFEEDKFYIVNLISTCKEKFGISIFDLQGNFEKGIFEFDQRTSRGPTMIQYQKLFNIKMNSLYIPFMYSLDIFQLDSNNNKLNHYEVPDQYINSVGKKNLAELDRIIKNRVYFSSEILRNLANNVEYFRYIDIADKYKYIKTTKSILLFDNDWSLKFVKNIDDFFVKMNTYRYPDNCKYQYLFGNNVGTWSKGIICASYPPTINGEINSVNPILRFYKYHNEN